MQQKKRRPNIGQAIRAAICVIIGVFFLLKKKGNDYIITVINNAQYASYVEYGHRQTPGRYVPALGLRLKKSWVPGRYMLTISTQELQQQAPKLIEQKLYQFLRPIFENG